VSRQACHLLEVLAQDLGVRFEPFAAIFVPVLFRVLVITVQVGARSCNASSLQPCMHVQHVFTAAAACMHALYVATDVTPLSVPVLQGQGCRL
jgi:hypothetical protein